MNNEPTKAAMEALAYTYLVGLPPSGLHMTTMVQVFLHVEWGAGDPRSMVLKRNAPDLSRTKTLRMARALTRLGYGKPRSDARDRRGLVQTWVSPGGQVRLARFRAGASAVVIYARSAAGVKSYLCTYRLSEVEHLARTSGWSDSAA